METVEKISGPDSSGVDQIRAEFDRCCVEFESGPESTKFDRVRAISTDVGPNLTDFGQGRPVLDVFFRALGRRDARIAEALRHCRFL